MTKVFHSHVYIIIIIDNFCVHTFTALYNISNISEVRIFNIFKLKVTCSKCLVQELVL